LREHLNSLELNHLQFNAEEDFDQYLRSALDHDDSMFFGGAIEKLIIDASNINFTSDDRGVCKEIAAVLFKNINFIFEKTSVLFCKDYVLRL
jgi:hypothetical protein